LAVVLMMCAPHVATVASHERIQISPNATTG